MKDYKEKTLESYQNNAKEFSKKFVKLLEFQKQNEIKKFIDLIPGKKILDLGCGAGDHVSFFEEQGFDVTGIDISSEMIVLCKKKNLNVQVMDIEDLTFEKESFDGIWAVTSLLHIPKNNLSLVLEKINSILKENGVLYVCLKKGQGEYFISDNESGEKRFFSFWEKEELLDFFGKYFDFIEFREGKLKTTIFLEVFFRKKLK